MKFSYKKQSKKNQLNAEKWKFEDWLINQLKPIDKI